MKHLLFIGTLNQPTSYFEGANGDGLSVHLFDDETLTAERLASAPQIVNPTFLSPTPDGSLVYANSEIEGWYEGLVTALSFDSKAGRLDHLNMQPSLGATTAHNAISRDGRHLFVVNYAMGAGGPDQALVAFERRADGSLAPGRISAAQSGTGPNAARQERSHPHSVTEIAPNLLLVADLGTDRLTVYSLEDEQFEKISETATRPGAGPRHVALHPSGRFVFVINELDSTVASYRIGAGGKLLEEIGVYPPFPIRPLPQTTPPTCRFHLTDGFSMAPIAAMTASQSSRSMPKPAGSRQWVRSPAVAGRRSISRSPRKAATCFVPIRTATSSASLPAMRKPDRWLIPARAFASARRCACVSPSTERRKPLSA